MKLESLTIKNYRRINEAHIIFGDATFLIGENNVGKSSILKALEMFFSETQKVHEEDFFKTDNGVTTDEIIIEAKFTNLPLEASTWRGFRGRVHKETSAGVDSFCIYYRKTYSKKGTFVRAMKSSKVEMKGEFKDCKTIDDFVKAGVSAEKMMSILGELDVKKNLVKAEKDKLEDLDELYSVDDTQSLWESNPGGFEGNVSIRLPKFLLIPAESRKEDVEGSGGVLNMTMTELFEEVRDLSQNFKKAHEYLTALSQELDPEDEEKEFGKMLKEVNNVVAGIFHESQLHVTTNLSDPSRVIKPVFEIGMSSNVRTRLERQGMGSVRSAAFALLRYREQFLQRKVAEGAAVRDLIIGFEEPEMYLHPNAAALMRDKIYELAISSYSNIICTTHSPYMIDLGKKIDEANPTKQVLNLFKLEFNDQYKTDCCSIVPFNTTEAYKKLLDDDKVFVKFLLKIDDNIARVFFCKNIIVIEGDTEEILLKETISRLPAKKRARFLSNYQVVKARGKATIISLVKYLKAMTMKPFVIHDEDTEEGATKFNAAILESLEGDEGKRLMVKHTIEDLLDYPEPNSEKPSKAYLYIQSTWGQDWQSIPELWRNTFEKQIAPELFSQEN